MELKKDRKILTSQEASDIRYVTAIVNINVTLSTHIHTLTLLPMFFRLKLAGEILEGGGKFNY